MTPRTLFALRKCSNPLVRLLVVDADARSREVLVQRMRTRSLDTDSAQTAAEAIDMMSTTKYDFVLLEVVMPHNGSVEIMEWMSHLPLAPRCIVMSGVAELWRRANPGIIVAGVLEKPFSIEELLIVINAVQRLTPSATETRATGPLSISSRNHA